MPGSIKEATIAMVSSSRALRRHVTRALASAGANVISLDPSADSLEREFPAAAQMVILGTDEDGGSLKVVLDYLFVAQPNLPVLVVAHPNSTHLIAELVDQHGLNNLIARHGGLAAAGDMIDEVELIATCSKLLSRDIFGLEKYFPTTQLSLHSYRILNRSDKRAAIDDLREFLEQIACPRAIIPSVETCADELIMNAIFNAPIDKDGKRKYVQVNRRSSFSLLPEEAVQFKFACDGRQVVLAVADPFGSLRREVIARYLRQSLLGERAGIEHKPAGAGLGLFMVFNAITQLVFNVQRGVRTEVLASFYIRSGLKGYRSSGRSLNIFILSP